jgi:hypothetical protein
MLDHRPTRRVDVAISVVCVVNASLDQPTSHHKQSQIQLVQFKSRLVAGLACLAYLMNAHVNTAVVDVL